MMRNVDHGQRQRRLQRRSLRFISLLLLIAASIFFVAKNVLFAIDVSSETRTLQEPTTFDNRQQSIEMTNFTLNTTTIGQQSYIDHHPNHQTVAGKEIIKDKNAPRSIMKKQNYTSSNRTRAVVHMGIHKTGSTTIQKLSKLHAKELKLDGYEMPWHLIVEGGHNASTVKLGEGELRHFENQVNFATCFLPSSNTEKLLYPCDEGLLSAGIEIAKRKQNILISAETFSGIQTDEAAELLKYLSNWDEVVVIVYHRRFYSWVASVYNQMYKGREHVMRGDRANMTIVDFIEHRIAEPMHTNNINYSYFLLERIKEHFGNNIVIMDYHDQSKGSSDKSFFCHALPNATTTCKKMKRNNVKSNSAASFDYEDLAYGAKMAGLIDLKDADDLEIAVMAIQQKHKMMLRLKFYVFKKICPSSDVLDKLWEFSLKVEKSIFPDRFKNDDDDGSSYLATMRLEFEKMATTKLCKLDVDSILSEDIIWKRFFEEFESKKQSYIKMLEFIKRRKQRKKPMRIQ